jgi:hypothetical protein
MLPLIPVARQLRARSRKSASLVPRPVKNLTINASIELMTGTYTSLENGTLNTCDTATGGNLEAPANLYGQSDRTHAAHFCAIVAVCGITAATLFVVSRKETPRQRYTYCSTQTG